MISSASNSTPATTFRGPRAGQSISADRDWVPPDADTLELTYAVTSTVVEQFAHGHTVSDVLRELVQNEYDGHGRSLSIEFSEEGLKVRGTGESIDPAGWQRLSVMLGTGHVAGDDREVAPKTNGIGSKNHGLRSLFLIGDQIYVRSGGLQTLLDLRRGAPRQAIPDESSSLRGVHIFVPYRTVRNGLLEPYGIEREAHDLDIVCDQLAPTLMKLAQPGSSQGIRTVTVRSVRNARCLVWNQKVKIQGRHGLGGPIVRREIDVRNETSKLGTKIVELEYQKSYKIPDDHRERRFPNYFRAGAGRLQLEVSVRLNRKRPDTRHQGLFYYPLGAAQITGCGVGVNAPFEMNAERTALVDPGNSNWNAWLLDTLANFTVDLLAANWFDEFGAAAYLAIDTPDLAAAGSLFASRLQSRLSEARCWPTRARRVSSRRPQFVVSSEMFIGASTALDAIVPEAQRLHATLAESRVSEMALRTGARTFNVSSAIRLRCAGRDASNLVTRVDASNSLYYPKFPGAVADIKLQERFAAAFDTHRRQLTSANQRDLANTETTLTAAGGLAAPAAPLWIVDNSVASVAPVPDNHRLHPRLARYRAISRLCRPFDPSEWARQTASQAAEGLASEADKERLYQYLIRAPGQIRRNTWPILRSSPIVCDHRGHWIEPVNLIDPTVAGAHGLKMTLHLPSKEVVSNPALMKLLRVRTKITGVDLVTYAARLVERPHLAARFENTLYEFRSLLTRSTVSKLRPIAFLRSRAGGLIAPENAYIHSTTLVHALGENAPYAVGPRESLYKRLGCRTWPSSNDIIAHLKELLSVGRPPSRPDIVYPLLVEALRVEGESPAKFVDERILYCGNAWIEPNDALVGKRHCDIFLGSVPVLTGSALRDPYVSLGVATEPRAHHWIRFFTWIDSNKPDDSSNLTKQERRALRMAYTKLEGLPVDLPSRTRALLGMDGQLYSIEDAHAGKYLIDDDPRMAQNVRRAGLAIAFADLEEAGGRRFYQASGVRLLTQVRRALDVKVGEEHKGPVWFPKSYELAQLQRYSFAAALSAIAAVSDGSQHIATSQLHGRLAEIRDVRFVRSIETTYDLSGSEVNVPSDFVLLDGSIFLVPVHSRSELRGRIARCIASLFDATASTQHTLSDSIYRVLTCENTEDINRYLEQRGITVSLHEPGAEEDLEPDTDESDSAADVGGAVSDDLLEAILTERRPAGPTPVIRIVAPAEDLSDASAEPVPLPALDQVLLRELDSGSLPSPRERSTERIWSWGGGRLRTPLEQQRDQEIGDRAEELVYLSELKRVTALGYPASRVVWTSRGNPVADHDVLSVADDGGDLWLEVKGTRGCHGRFDWPRAEFDRARRERGRYVLCRVYEADTVSPAVRRIVDPVGKLLDGQIRLDIATLAAEVPPLGET